jgi:hypothetical protein
MVKGGIGISGAEGGFLMQSAAHEPLYDIDPQTGATIEVFYADRSLETFGRCGAGWFWWPRRRMFTGWLAYRAVRYGLRGVSACDERDGGAR